MPLNTYANLRTSITKWGARDDLSDILDDFISLAETDMWKTLRIRDMETASAITVSGRVGTLPANYVAARSVILVSGGVSRRLDPYAPHSQQIKSGAGIPFNFTIQDDIRFNQTVSGTVTLEYFKSLPGLTSSQTSNGVLSRFPDIYLNGCLQYVFKYAQDTEQELKYKASFEGAMLGANKQDRSGRYMVPTGHKRGSTP